MKKIVLLLAALTLSLKASAQEQHSCFYNVALEPAFIAFNTHKNSELDKWYKNTFGLEVVKEFEVPDGSATGIIMRKDDFIVEIFFRNHTAELHEKKDNTRSKPGGGIMKIGLFTDASLTDLKDCLNNNSGKAGRIFRDQELGIDLLHLTDPEGNVLEIISRVND
ncbi:VOC family protein [Robertkochia aurantiaca]|uniref:VOC family protein n=1 Tax=Robertkochia aurantiaca TaxID=2873700 RepID=UPI001CC93CC2|nr:hypothetical protein [Robertkochia sp. 3YJGBD-33]